MNGLGFILAFYFTAHLAFPPWSVPSQQTSGGTKVPAPAKKEPQEWVVKGLVTTLSGEPVHGAQVTVELSGGQVPAQVTNTDLRGGFRAEFSLEASLPAPTRARVTAAKDGYLNGMESADVARDGSATAIDVVLREGEENADQLPLASLISGIAPEFRAQPPGASSGDSERAEYASGTEAFFERHSSEEALPLLVKAVEREPGCVLCRTLLGLALLKAGSWSGSLHELNQAAALAVTPDGRATSPEPFLILGVLESWQGRPKIAAGLYSQALQAQPANPLALQELGRADLLQKDFQTADQDLSKAIKAGAPIDAHLLRARALLGEGRPADADAEMQAYLGDRKPKELSMALRGLWSQMKARVDLESETQGVKSVVDLPLPELTKAWPELNSIEAARSQDELTPALKKVGEGVEMVFSGFPNTSSLEGIRQERLRRDGKVAVSQSQNFQYLLLARSDKAGLGLEEYRTDVGGMLSRPRGLESGFMLTAGFASASLPFHPAYQPESRFRLLGRQTVDRRQALVIAFAQRPETAQLLGSFKVNEVSAATLTQGIAWVDPDSYQIIRLQTDLLKPIDRLQLEKETTEIRYGEVHFKDNPLKLWLPKAVAVTVDWKGRFFRNWHMYSEFKLFNVKSEQKAGRVQAPAGDPGEQ